MLKAKASSGFVSHHAIGSKRYWYTECLGSAILILITLAGFFFNVPVGAAWMLIPLVLWFGWTQTIRARAALHALSGKPYRYPAFVRLVRRDGSTAH